MTGSLRQTRLMSAIEAVINVFVGYALAVLTQALIFPVFGLNVTISQHLGLGLAFTFVSLIRSYVLRRLFNRWA